MLRSLLIIFETCGCRILIATDAVGTEGGGSLISEGGRTALRLLRFDVK